jgi:hypothetical protein
MADATSFDPYANMARRRINQWPLRQFKLAGTYRLHYAVR